MVRTPESAQQAIAIEHVRSWGQGKFCTWAIHRGPDICSARWAWKRFSAIRSDGELCDVQQSQSLCCFQGCHHTHSPWGYTDQHPVSTFCWGCITLTFPFPFTVAFTTAFTIPFPNTIPNPGESAPKLAQNGKCAASSGHSEPKWSLLGSNPACKVSRLEGIHGQRS